ncbi:type IV toxin-antitoxin system AbiEi family antitoxin domain-containing protein [Marinobacter salarius]|nr:type IV toxin-antitoxin system AbiEi family antitoxin domain-containing protein [Marinobacter salarius]
MNRSESLSRRVETPCHWICYRNCNGLEEVQWSVKLRAEEYNLGSGKRVIAKNGKLDPTYLITVPLGNAGDIQA